jgi:DNA-binding GntR family transcriptional regulator
MTAFHIKVDIAVGVRYAGPTPSDRARAQSGTLKIESGGVKGVDGVSCRRYIAWHVVYEIPTAGTTERTPMAEAVMSSVSVPSRTEAVLDAVKHAILTGRLSPGRPLIETELAAQLGVSKTPVREALKTLSGAGLVTMSPYKGASVRTVDDALAHSVYDIRILLEPEAVRRSAAPGESADWEAARAALDAADLAADRADRQQANREFHRSLYLGCGNDLMVGILDGLRDQTALVSTVVWERNAGWEQEAAEHRAILEAVRAGRADMAASLLEEHIRAFVERNFGRREATRGDE